VESLPLMCTADRGRGSAGGPGDGHSGGSGLALLVKPATPLMIGVRCSPGLPWFAKLRYILIATIGSVKEKQWSHHP
jgi:hypothetical protein